ncbi:Transmembrane amino acid transporter [Colletotrichum higginsianum IMI 349063]|uniref:Transmembrane amino acid transporter n=1 Tax=Colletotrichum higginsianum (strain IMI 349063) TaxID=759273 RepID=A0A1B7Y8H2_COLHI|nr:Transmembrane amino acid transporter [Colletotrichum higginsianum IMI 349063]OBR08248.1 Transmembrane amino acid transporter [Colletotrichum higginsianum IMI 349063]
MPNYSSITDGNANSIASGSSDEMSRQRRRNGKEGGGQASMTSSVINLLNTIVGAGTLAMPSVVSHMGCMLGVLMIIWSGMTAAFGLYLQSRCARYLDRGTSSFFAISKITYPNAAIIFDTAIAIKCFGVGVSYMIIIGDLMPKVFVGLFSGAVATYPYLGDRNFWITAFMLVIIPLSFLKKLDSLKYTSIVALVSIGYLVILVIYHFATDRLKDMSEIRVIEPESAVAFLSTLPVVVFAYTCHQNMFAILNEIKDNSPSSVIGVVGSSIGGAASIYIVVAITGYLTFGNKVVGNIVMMCKWISSFVLSFPDPHLDSATAASYIGQLAIVVLVTFSVPLQVHPCRASVDAILKWRPNRSSSGNGRPSSPGGRPLLPSSASVHSDHGSSSSMGETRFAILTSIILILSYVTALSVHSLERVLAYVGSTGSTSISFILPGLFYYKISDPDSMHQQRLHKEDDDADYPSDEEDADPMVTSIASLGSVASVVANPRQWNRKWRWDLEHIEQDALRKMALALAIYGVCVMVVCLFMNIVFHASH